MKKILFKDRYGLTAAVLEKRKTMTRRVERIDFYPGSREEQIEKFCKRSATDAKGRSVWLGFDNKGNQITQLISHYAIGEEIAVAQSYKTLIEQGYLCRESDGWVSEECVTSPGYSNKMFVRADLMSHRIRITNIRMERLQDIRDEDCMGEGITTITEGKNEVGNAYGWDVKIDALERDSFFTPRAAFAALIDKVSGNGTWERNPWVFVYEFELIK